MKISGLLYVNDIFSECRIKPHLVQLAEIVVLVTMTVMMLNYGYDTEIRLNLLELAK